MDPLAYLDSGCRKADLDTILQYRLSGGEGGEGDLVTERDIAQARHRHTRIGIHENAFDDFPGLDIRNGYADVIAGVVNQELVRHEKPSLFVVANLLQAVAGAYIKRLVKELADLT
jgi:hypothetical protein